MKKITLIFTVMMLITCISFGQKKVINNLTKKRTEKQIYQKGAAISTSTTSKGAKSNLNETFESTVPPIGWSSIATTWISSSTSTISTIETTATGHTGHFAVFDAYDDTLNATGSLVTPALIPATGVSDTLTYKVDLVQVSTNTGYKGTGAKMYIEYSTNGGTTWTTSTTNVLSSLTNYNKATTGWITKKVALTTYVGKTINIRFRAISDYGWCMIAIDNVTGPPISLPTNDMTSGQSFIDFDGFSTYAAMPATELGNVYYGNIIQNAGSNAETNVIMHVDINNSAITGQSPAIASFASLTMDTAWALPVIPATPATYAAKLYVSQNETDVNPSNNVGDSIYFDVTNNDYFRTYGLTDLLDPYSFGTSAPATIGMEYGANYHFNNPQEVDTIYAVVYSSTANGQIKAKLYNIDTTSGVRTVVDSSVITTLVPANLPALVAFPLVTPYTTTKSSILTASVALECVIANHDTIAIGADGGFAGDASLAGIAYLYVSSAWGWYSVTGTVPIIGLYVQDITTGINNKSFNNSISTFPNPANSEINIISSSAIGNVKLINSVGQIVFENIINSNSYVMNTANFEKGMYVMRIENEKGVSTKKVIICR